MRNLRAAPPLTSPSAISLPCIPACPGTQKRPPPLLLLLLLLLLPPPPPPLLIYCTAKNFQTLLVLFVSLPHVSTAVIPPMHLIMKMKASTCITYCCTVLPPKNSVTVLHVFKATDLYGQVQQIC